MLTLFSLFLLDLKSVQFGLAGLLQNPKSFRKVSSAALEEVGVGEPESFYITKGEEGQNPLKRQGSLGAKILL